MESAHQFSSRPDCNNKAEVPPLLCALLFRQSHLFLIYVVPTYNDSRKDLHKLCRIVRNSQCKRHRAYHLDPRTFARFPVFPVMKFLFRTDTTGSIGWTSPAPRIISMIVSRLTIFTENLVICCYQVTTIFCTRYGSAIASSAQGPCNFGPLTDLAISVFLEVSLNTVLTQILTSLCSRL